MKNLQEKIELANQKAEIYNEEIIIKTRVSKAFPGNTIIQVFPKQEFICLAFLTVLGKILGDPFPSIKAIRKNKLLIEYWINEAD